ncbi:MAG: hypothetical protein HY287_14100 [Planctomycetes bacterium]|nr:hypothetical protein [Planctomycetota bacterium]
MSGSNPKLNQLRLLQLAVCAVALVGAATLIGLGLIGYGSSPGVWMVAAGGLLLFFAILAITVMPVLLKIESTQARQLDEIRELHEKTSKQLAHLENIAANTLISDAAKSLANRERELDALRSVIRDDIRNERWEAALTLINEMERRFGYRDEAERSREELDDARNDRIQLRLNEAIEIIEAHFRVFDWERAAREIDRLRNALPDEPRVQALDARMTMLRELRKQELLRMWDEAVRNEDTDHAIELLKDLDLYMSRSEAQALEDSARQIFKQRLLQLGIQFRFAVNEKRWQDALHIGLDIVREFPNTRMANEVRELLDTLRERARQAEGDLAGAKAR